MKKYLIFSMAFVIMSFAGITNVSAASIGSQSIDVTVGEVDKIDTDDAEQDIQTPDTGLFGLETGSASIAIAVTIPTIVILACVLGYAYRKHAKKS